MNQSLDRLGLRGSYQLHQAPVVLRPDQRAHQVFQGFEDLEEVHGLLERLYPDEFPCWVVTGEQHTACSLSTLPGWTLDSTLVVPAASQESPGGLYGLVWVVDRLLGPGGCPWDQAQTHETLTKHLIEESYELIDAIELNDQDKMKEELGDVLLQPLMHTQMRQLAGDWGIDDAARGITDKLIRRHPHVFGDVEANDADTVLKNWDTIKKAEKGDQPNPSILDGVPSSMPSLLRAFDVSKRAARTGFEWPDIEAVWGKVEEETLEVKEAIQSGDPDKIESEIGDLLFTIVQVARWQKTEPEQALRRMLNRFTARYKIMESEAGKPLHDLSFEEWDRLWTSAKSQVD
jgi:tetrapyrrole methylase family protein/MazG family protein